MKLIRYPQLTPNQKPSVVTIGNFDGVHLGHQYLINKTVELAKRKNMASIVVTMQPLASQYFKGKFKVTILTPFKQKYSLIKDCDIDIFCPLNFNKKLANTEADEFIENILLKGLNAKHIIIGDDFRFAKNRSGDFEYLKAYCSKNNIVVESIETITNDNVRISSSFIRKKLAESQFKNVEALLGRKYSICGRVSKGQQLGRTLNFPTINIKLKNYKSPINGVFCVSLIMDDGSICYGSANLGTRPTVEGIGEILEVYILDFDKSIYGQFVTILFHHKIRNEVKFDTLDQLKLKIEEDVCKTRLYFSNLLNYNR